MADAQGTQSRAGNAAILMAVSQWREWLIAPDLFQYIKTRAKYNPKEILKGFKGYLMIDG